MKKKIRTILMIAILAIAMFVTVACGNGGTGEGSAPGAKTYDLSFSMHTAANSTYGDMIQKMFDEIEQKTDGNVKIKIYGSATLAAAKDVADMVKNGGCDLGWIFTSFYPNQYPLTDVIQIPLQNAKTSEQGTAVLWDLYENYPQMAEEWSNYKILQMYANPVSYVYSAEEFMRLDDLKGKSIRSTSGGVAECLGAWGANVISMPPNDIYDGMSKHNIQGFVAEPTMIADYTLGEVAPSQLQIPLYQAAFVIAMNKDVYNSMPDEYKKVIDSYGTREASLAFAKELDTYVASTQTDYESKGGKIIPFTEEQLKLAQPAVDEYIKKWVSDNSREGFEAQIFFDECKAAYEKYAQ